MALKGPAGERTDKVDLLKILELTFRGLRREICLVPGCLVDVESGMEFRPGMVNFQPNNDLSVQTVTTIEITHSAKFPKAFFEYQHAGGADTAASIQSGFEAWTKVDLPPLLDAVRAAPQSCSALEMTFPSGRARRVVLGPVAVMMDKARQLQEQARKDDIANRNKGANEGNKAGDADAPNDACEAHPTPCPCCLFTNCHEAFQPLLDREGSFAIRLYAIRYPDGGAQADCRVNGKDFPPGAEALRAYVKKWPHTGLETRKQYIIIQDGFPAEKSSPARQRWEPLESR